MNCCIVKSLKCYDGIMGVPLRTGIARFNDSNIQRGNKSRHSAFHILHSGFKHAH
jgi:hypothetical protein